MLIYVSQDQQQVLWRMHYEGSYSKAAKARKSLTYLPKITDLSGLF